jgi:hypothetical protein
MKSLPTTALLSGAGLLVGRRFGASLGKRLDVAGGLVLIGDDGVAADGLLGSDATVDKLAPRGSPSSG